MLTNTHRVTQKILTDGLRWARGWRYLEACLNSLGYVSQKAFFYAQSHNKIQAQNIFQGGASSLNHPKSQLWLSFRLQALLFILISLLHDNVIFLTVRDLFTDMHQKPRTTLNYSLIQEELAKTLSAESISVKMSLFKYLNCGMQSGILVGTLT